jgi:hypothetical protein
MRAILVASLLLWVASPRAVATAPTGENCDLAEPPAVAGEEFYHGVTLKVFPRARDISRTYTGCQILWAPDANGWNRVSLTYLENGDPIRLWFPADLGNARASCTYRRGVVVEGSADRCAVPQSLLVKSLPPGCVERVKAARGPVEGCQYE